VWAPKEEYEIDKQNPTSDGKSLFLQPRNDARYSRDVRWNGARIRQRSPLPGHGNMPGIPPRRVAPPNGT